MGRPYTVMASSAVSTSTNLLQVTAPSTMTLEIIRAWVMQSTSTTSAQTDIILVRKSATASAGSTATPVKLEVGDPAPTFTAMSAAGTNGTDTDIVYGEGFNILNGWLYSPVPEERIIVPPSGMLALKFPSTPPSATYRYGITLREHG